MESATQENVHAFIEQFVATNKQNELVNYITTKSNILACVDKLRSIDIEREKLIDLLRLIRVFLPREKIQILMSQSIKLEASEFISIGFLPRDTIAFFEHMMFEWEATFIAPSLDNIEAMPLQPILSLGRVCREAMKPQLNNLYRRILSNNNVITILTNNHDVGEIEDYDITKDSLAFCLLSLFSGGIKFGSSATDRDVELIRIIAMCTENMPEDMMIDLFDGFKEDLHPFDPFNLLLYAIAFRDVNRRARIISTIGFLLLKISPSKLKCVMDLADHATRSLILQRLFNNKFLADVLAELDDDEDKKILTLVASLPPDDTSKLAKRVIEIIKSKPNPSLVINAITVTALTATDNEYVGYQIDGDSLCKQFVLKYLTQHMDDKMVTAFILACTKAEVSIFHILHNSSLKDLSPFNTQLIESCKLLYPKIEECPICLEIKDIGILPSCQHEICPECAVRIRNTNNTCPFCRANVSERTISLPSLTPSFL